MESKYIEVNGSKMHYLEAGQGDPILFLHTIPVSSYVWRNIIPQLATLGHCIAPDLIGMGKSDKPDIEYTILDHIQYIEKFIAKLNLKKILIVMHGWGSLIGFDYAMKHENNCKGLVFYESYLRSKNNDDLSLPFQEQIVSLKNQKNIKDLILNGTFFLDRVLSQSILNALSEEEMSHYREPYLQKNSGKVLYQYLQEVPSGDGRSKADKIIFDYSKKMVESSLPKLMLYSVPGFITTIATLMWAKEHLPNLNIVEVGEDLHYAMESHPVLMGQTISAWLQSIEQN